MSDTDLIECDRQEFRAQLRRMELLGVVQTHENQYEIALKVEAAMSENNYQTLYIMVIAETQSGKTGSMLEIIKMAINVYKTPPKHIFIITGLSSTEWKRQTKDRFPGIFEEHIFHNNDVEGKLEMSLRGKKNVLIIIDELHMAAKDDQTIAKAFKNCKLDDPEFTTKNQIRIVEYSATPDGPLRDRMRLDQRSQIITAKAGTGYVGPFELLDRGDIFQAKDLSEKHHVAELHAHIMGKFHEPKYHIIRVHTQGKKKDKISSNFDELKYIGNFDTKTYQQKDGDIEDINVFLSTPPERHTFIFIKDMLRCAKTLVKTNIGVVYERLAKNVNDTAIIQGLLGRMTGYDVPDYISIFTNINTVERYRQLWETHFDIDEVPWNCNTKRTLTYATDVWCEDPARGIKNRKLDISYRLFSEEERWTTLAAFTKQYMNWIPKKESGMNIKDLSNYTGQEIAKRKWGVNHSFKKRIARGCDGVWVILWLTEAFNIPQ